jgi:hypothetical protein
MGGVEKSKSFMVGDTTGSTVQYPVRRTLEKFRMVWTLFFKRGWGSKSGDVCCERISRKR